MPGNGSIDIFRAPGTRVSPMDLEVQTGAYPLQYAPLSLVSFDGGKSGYIPQKVRQARVSTNTGPLAAGAYFSALKLDLVGARAVRVHRIGAFIVDALAGGDRVGSPKLTIVAMDLCYNAAPGPHEDDSWRVSGFGGLGPQNEIGGLASPYPLGAARLPTADLDLLASTAGGEGLLSYESPSGIILLPNKQGPPFPAPPAFASLELHWQRTAALNDEDLAVMLVTYSILAEGMWPER